MHSGRFISAQADSHVQACPSPPTHVMHCYRAYTLSIASEIALPELAAGGEATPDARGEAARGQAAAVTIRSSSSAEDVPPPEACNWGSLLVDRVPEALSYFAVREGREMIVDPEAGIEAGKVRALVLGMLMGALLRQRGYLTLHAACVARGGRAVAFVGDTGWGKSTLADLFHRHGYAVLNDDVLAIDTAGEVVTALPGYPQIKLRPNPNAEAGRDFEALAPLYEGSLRRVLQAHRRFPRAPLPLAKVYLLEGTPSTEHCIAPLPRQQAFMELVGHTRMNGWFKDPAYKRRHFQQCEALLRGVPVARLRRKRTDDPQELAAIERLVARDVGLPAAAPAVPAVPAL